MKLLSTGLAVVALCLLASRTVKAEDPKPGDAKAGERHAKLLEKFDTNGDGKLDDAERAKMREEFAKRKADGKGGEFNREAFVKKFDANGDGKLDDEERAKAREAIAKHRAEAGKEDHPGRKAMLKKFDANGDGKLDDAERAKMRDSFGGQRPHGPRPGVERPKGVK